MIFIIRGEICFMNNATIVLRLSEIKYYFVDLPHQDDIVAASMPLIDECIQLFENYIQNGNYVSAQLMVLKQSLLKSKDPEWTRLLLQKVPQIMDSLQ